MTPRIIDDPDRKLTPREQREFAGVAAALGELPGYFDRAAAWGTLTEAIAHRAPVVPRTKGTPDDEFGASVTALYVNPRLVLEEMAAARPDLDPVIDVQMVQDALVYIGGRPAATIEGRDERPTRPSPWRNNAVASWFRLSREMVIRLRVGQWTPVLAPMPGRPTGELSATSSARRPGVQALRSGAHMMPNDVVRLLRAFLLDREPTTSARNAIGYGRPLVIRRPGRPPRHGFGLDVETAVVAIEALRAFSVSNGALLKVPPVGSVEAMRQAIVGAEEKLNGATSIVSRASSADRAADTVLRRGWLRCSLPRLGLPNWDGDVVAAELIDLRTQRNAQ